MWYDTKNQTLFEMKEKKNPSFHAQITTVSSRLFWIPSTNSSLLHGHASFDHSPNRKSHSDDPKGNKYNQSIF